VWQESSGGRRVFKFRLEMAGSGGLPRMEVASLDRNRVIPTHVKLEVWKRDRGKCVICGSKDNLHFDHIIPYSRGGSSLDPENIQLLCARHNIAKRDKIE
jgi:5-methylcytosine-specific restriction endonuclease McrA